MKLFSFIIDNLYDFPDHSLDKLNYQVNIPFSNDLKINLLVFGAETRRFKGIASLGLFWILINKTIIIKLINMHHSIDQDMCISEIEIPDNVMLKGRERVGGKE